MYKKIICLLLSIVFLITVHGNLVFANELSLPQPGDQSALENLQSRENLSADEALRELKEIKDTVTDRFIIKLNENFSVSLKSSVNNAFNTAKEVKDQAVATILEINEITVDSVYSEDSNVSLSNQKLKDVLTEIDASISGGLLNHNFALEAQTQLSALQEGKQVIALPEKVDPEVFVREIQENLINEVEYIQPDYQVELAANEDEAISLEVIPIGPDGKLEEIELPPSAQPSQESDKAEEPTAIPEVTASPSAEPIKPEETQEPSETSIPSAEPEEPAADETVNPEPTTVPDSVIVAVIDTGIDVTHPDLEAHVVDGYNSVADNNQVYDAGLGMEQAHGTHVAGIIAQTAPDAQIMPLKCFENGRAYTSDLIKAIDYAKANGASIVNCSWGSKDNNRALKEAMENSGLFFVCAAGNNRMNVDETPIYPASFGLENTISVTALNQDYGFSYFSNYGTSSIDIAAIGREVESSFPGGDRGIMNGTSMSAGFVSGAAAIAKASGETNIKTRIIATGDRLSNLQNKLKAGRALNLDHLISNTQSDEILDCNPADDFDVHGYQPTPEENWELFNSVPNAQVGGGEGFSIALKEDGTVWAWGDNSIGQLGDGTKLPCGIPKRIVGLTGVSAIAAGFHHAVALKKDGTMVAWGYNAHGQLGDGTLVDRTLPTTVIGLTGVTAVAAGDFHTSALNENGSVFSWGENTYGQLGNGTETEECVRPIEVIGLTGVAAIAAGGSHTVALKEDETVVTWGYNVATQQYTIPTVISGLTGVSAIAVGSGYTIALKKNGTVVAWGSNSYGALGDGTTTERTTPTAVPGLTGVVAIAAGYHHTVALKGDGTVVVWGYNKDGQVGDGTTMNRLTPTKITGLTGVTSIAAARYHTLVLKDDKSVIAWGNNRYGQVGDGTMLQRARPTAVADLTGVTAIAAGYEHTVALKEDGTVVTWGHVI